MLRQSIALTLFAVLSVTAFAAQAKTVTIEGLDSLKFSVEQITVQPGEQVTVKLTNNTKMPPNAMSHNFILLTADADPKAVAQAAVKAKDNDYVPTGMSDKIIAHTGLVAGGESDTVTFTAPDKPGDYTYICGFPGHYAAGMKGTLTVASGG